MKADETAKRKHEGDIQDQQPLPLRELEASCRRG